MSSFTAPAPIQSGFVLPEIGRILCCMCGLSIIPNEAAMCNACLKLQYHSEYPKSYEIELIQCSKCNKWHNRQSHWIAYDMETPELLSFCLKKIPFLANASSNSIKILDSNWIWTEPHSKRLKLYANYEHKLSNYQSLAITNQIQAEYIIKNKQCMNCIYENNDHQWNAMIQLRSFSASSSLSSAISSNSVGITILNTHLISKLFYQIETLLIQSKMYEMILDIETVNLSTQRVAGNGGEHHHSGQHKPQANAVTNGLNLYFYQKNQAEKVMHFLSEYFPFITKTSKKIISLNQQNNSSRYEHIILMELLPVNRYDVMIIPKQLHGKYDVMLVTKLSSVIHGITPRTLQEYSINVMKYCQYPFQTILNEKYLLPFIVLDITPIYGEGGNGGSVVGEGGSIGSTLSFMNGSNHPTNHAKKKRHGKKVHKTDVWLAGEKNKGESVEKVSSEAPLVANIENENTKDDARSVMSLMSGVGGTGGSKWQLADVVVAKESDLGDNDTTYTVRTHLGNVLQVGDTVLGYDLLHTVFGLQQEFSLKKVKESDIPEIILVKKVVPEKDRKTRKRKNRIPPWRKNKEETNEGEGSNLVSIEESRELAGNEFKGMLRELEEAENDEEYDEEFEDLLQDLSEQKLETIVEFEEEDDVDNEGIEEENDEDKELAAVEEDDD